MQRHFANIKNRRTIGYIKSHHLLIMDRVNQLLQHGFTFVEAIQFVYQQLHVDHSDYTEKFNTLLNSGASCYEIFKFLKYPQVILMQLYFAEKYGVLTDTLTQCLIYYKKHKTLKSQFIKALQYPIILMIIFFILITILNATVMPEFDYMYDAMAIEQSLLQLTLSAFISHFTSIFLIIFIFGLVTYVLFRHWLQQRSMQQQINILTHLPLFNRYFRLFMTYQMSQQFVLFFKNGITMNDIVQIYLEQEESHFLKYIGEKLKTDIQKGDTFSNILSHLNCFEANFIDYIEQGEHRDKLDIELSIYNKFIMDHIQSFIKKHISLIQPIMFAFIGALVMAVYLVMMLPIFEMMQSIQQ
ncbi:competence type IV pilus assembly protein ComGB [Staphylococcus sp. 17KM0847]|uniref:competence type IV pilus assembly protein ComGB n=1 Tax=Staphylococcus sp. 17KM0847 TaxID=2583989 RepID=UPI0015DD16D7|nr:competence type IV pilus assembly protein ComGB [Staphylococcus sp. 17KM0847]QLK86076.1 type II secretion system F family protein [Staphylococcus sp. 17KM0847]